MSKREAFISYIREACADPSVGYSQIHRWRDPDVDCSSLVLLACNHAYGTTYTSGYTGTLKAQLEAVGFKAYHFNDTVCDRAPGAVYLNEGNHVETMVLPGIFGGASIDENGGITGSRGGDQTGKEVLERKAYVYKRGWDWALVPPDEASSPTPVTPTPSNTKDIDTVAKEVLGGLWGNNPERRERLLQAGYDYQVIQQRVNEILATANTTAGKVTPTDLDVIAWEVIRGTYENGQARKDALAKAGFDYQAVQTRVNELLG